MLTPSSQVAQLMMKSFSKYFILEHKIRYWAHSSCFENDIKKDHLRLLAVSFNTQFSLIETFSLVAILVWLFFANKFYQYLSFHHIDSTVYQRQASTPSDRLSRYHNVVFINVFDINDSSASSSYDYIKRKIFSFKKDILINIDDFYKEGITSSILSCERSFISRRHLLA